jgi:hypothetical protein
MTHFFQRTSPTLPLTDEFACFWQQEIPKLAEANKFLQHSLLALSALHICHIHPESFEHYYALSCEHHFQALKIFRTTITDIDTSNCDAILSFSIIVSIFHFNTSLRSDLSRKPGFPDILETFFTLRNGRNLTWGMRHSLSRSPSGLNFKRIGDALIPETDETDWANLDTLDNLNKTSVNSEEIRDNCNAAIQSLRELYVIFGSYPRTWLHLAWWPSAISEQFITLLQQKQPVALTIFLHWCRVFSRAPKRWYFDGWAQRAMSCVVDILDSEPEDLNMTVPKAMESITDSRKPRGNMRQQILSPVSPRKSVSLQEKLDIP